MEVSFELPAKNSAIWLCMGVACSDQRNPLAGPLLLLYAQVPRACVFVVCVYEEYSWVPRQRIHARPDSAYSLAPMPLRICGLARGVYTLRSIWNSSICSPVTSQEENKLAATGLLYAAAFCSAYRCTLQQQGKSPPRSNACCRTSSL
jgi:hypothetical protein